ncbi:PQQ-binding-like beta-propeller repeat protein [Alicyclobacillus sp. SP_1]|uniref:outer membrane protein assembly factor BamB family protein n=1 Tax=Alicyclobacillus sp. SP_1 TaxID=2942475 RepID=UPI00215701BF|nr:PQQ-binding-like beta-propeller repeat protein [Alicyclobacillus sp. SP_1]
MSIRRSKESFFSSGGKTRKSRIVGLVLLAVLVALIVLFLMVRSVILAAMLSNYYPQHWIQYGLTRSHAASWFRTSLNYRWTYPLKSMSHGGGAIVNGSYFIGDDSGRVTSMDMATGRSNWVTHVASNNIMTVPLVFQGKVYVGVGNHNFKPGDTVRGTGVNEIVALSQKTGRILWTFPTPGEDMPTFVLHRKVLYALGGDGVFRALNPVNGQLLWSLKLGGVCSMSSPVVVNDLFFAGMSNPYRTVAVNTKTHGLAFQTPFPKASAAVDDASIAYGGGMVYQQWVEQKPGSPTYRRQAMSAINIHNGQVLWTYYEPYGTKLTSEEYEAAPPVFNNGVLYFGSSYQKMLHAVDVPTGRPLWTLPLKAAANETPVVTDNAVVIGDIQGNLYVVDKLNGKVMSLQSYPGQMFLNAEAVFCNGVFYAPMSSVGQGTANQSFVRATPISN